MDIFEYGSRNASVVLLQPVDEHDLEIIKNEIALIHGSVSQDFRLAAFRVGDWNNDLSPWPAPAVFGREDFGGGAEETLTEIESYCADRTKTYYVGGYSLAGLFAIWAAYRTDLFRGVAAASPSLWFPGFTDYMGGNAIKCAHVYLSLGDREEKARNPVMATVGDRVRQACGLLKGQGVDCALEWNPGNHFRDADVRTAKAFSWVMGRPAS
ncbi:MAG: esterase [Oscillospiraceae bacterium]|nr:esterase [Oscillospiraceae bacterium]